MNIFRKNPKNPIYFEILKLGKWQGKFGKASILFVKCVKFIEFKYLNCFALLKHFP